MVAIPRKHYTRTKTGIVIGCAHINHLPPTVDEHTTIIQQTLLNRDKYSKRTKWQNTLYVLFVIGLMFFALVHSQPN